MGERMLLDLRRQCAHVLPFRQRMSIVVAPQPYVPEVLVMGLLMLCGCDEALRRLDLIHGAVAAIASSPGLRLARRACAYRLRSALCMHQRAAVGVFRSFEVIADHFG